MIKASDFLIPTIIPVFFKLGFRTILLPRSQSKWGYHRTGREAGEHRGHDTSALHKKNSNSAACISSAACLLCNSELRVFRALYYPFTDENDGAFLTVEGSKWLEMKLKYRNEDCTSGRAGKSFSLSLFQAKLRKIFFFSIPNQRKTSKLTEIFQKFHIATTEAEPYAFLNYPP